MVVRAAVVLVGLVACYSPNPPADVACGPEGACPFGQTCLDGYCRRDGSVLDAPGSDGDDSLDAPELDAARDASQVCTPGDNACPVACVASDPDCVTTCGDGRCVGNAGELCGNCPADCATLTVVCGNADCEPGENPDCYADCGPSPWTWATEEQSLITMINNARTAGTRCVSGGPLLTRPALTADGSMQAGAREWSWEQAHHEFHSSNGSACNGRTLTQRKASHGTFSSYVTGYGYASVTAAFNAFIANDSLCQILLSATVTKISVGVAFDTDAGFAIEMK